MDLIWLNRGRTARTEMNVSSQATDQKYIEMSDRKESNIGSVSVWCLDIIQQYQLHWLQNYFYKSNEYMYKKGIDFFFISFLFFELQKNQI